MALSSDQPRAAARCGDDAFSRSLGATCPQFVDGEKSGWAPEGRVIPIHVAEVARLLEPWRGARPVTAATFLAGGLMNRNYRVRVGNDDVVLRFYDRDARAFAKEVGLLSELHGRVAVPEVLYVGPSTESSAVRRSRVRRRNLDARAQTVR